MRLNGSLQDTASFIQLLEETCEANDYTFDHISVFGVVLKLDPGSRLKRLDLVSALRDRNIGPQDLNICLVHEKAEIVTRSDGTTFPKSEGYGLVGGGVDVGDFFEEKKVPGSSSSGFDMRSLLAKVSKEKNVTSLFTAIENALKRESYEEAGLCVYPLWGMAQIDVKGDGIVVSIVCGVESEDEGVMDEEEIREKKFVKLTHLPHFAQSVPPMYRTHKDRCARLFFNCFGDKFRNLACAIRVR